MKTVILCGGKGTRMGEVGELIPKPLIRIGNHPVLWHIMKIYSSYGFNDFILCMGYKGDQIKKYFTRHKEHHWNIEFIDTGEESTKSERIKKIKDLISDDNFFLAYGDDLADVNLRALLDHHTFSKSMVTITATKLVSQFGIVEIDDDNKIASFKEKPVLDHWINSGFMVVNKGIFDYLDFGELENEVFERLTKEKNISVFKHPGKWKTMNTLKDNKELNELWHKGDAFWKLW